MSTKTPPPLQKSGGSFPQIVRLDVAFKLAEKWVNNMTKAAEDDPLDVEPESRPSRVGLGAKVAPHFKFGSLNDPVERKLHAKLEAGKRKAAKNIEDSIPSAAGGSDNDNDDDSDEELDSRTRAFEKKKRGPPAPSMQVKKKHK